MAATALAGSGAVASSSGLAAPEIAWEASLGIYLIVKRFKPSSILA